MICCFYHKQGVYVLEVFIAFKRDVLSPRNVFQSVNTAVANHGQDFTLVLS